MFSICFFVSCKHLLSVLCTVFQPVSSRDVHCLQDQYVI